MPTTDHGDEGQLVKLGDGTHCRTWKSADDVPVAINNDFACYDGFQVMQLGSYDAILGMPWLTANNPEIDWRKRTMVITRDGQRIKVDGMEETAASLSETTLGARKVMASKCERQPTKVNNEVRRQGAATETREGLSCTA